MVALVFNKRITATVAVVVVVGTALVLNHIYEWHTAPPYLVHGTGPSHRRHNRQRSPSLAVIMPVNNNTDLQFYRNMWVRDYLYPVCDYMEPHCSIVCNRKSTWKTLDKKTMCFTNIIKKEFKQIDFFIKLDDDAIVDRDYIFETMEKYKDYREPVYISDFILNLDGSNLALNGSYYGNGKFYMFNRRLVDCIDTAIRYRGQRNEDAVFGAMVYNGCGPGVVKILEDDSRLWHRGYTSKNKNIDLAAIKNH